MAIYQCYFQPNHRHRLFTHPPYLPFGLEPQVNPNLLDNCPELSDEHNRTQLCEYGAMLHLWRNPEQLQDPWIGFTSYRQLDKVRFELTESGSSQVAHLLERYDILTWFMPRFRSSMAVQADRHHPGLMKFMTALLREFGLAVPASFMRGRQGIFANYWIMTLDSFRDFMAWSFPMLQFCLVHRLRDPYVARHPKALGYVMERLFIVWYELERMSIHDLRENHGMSNRNEPSAEHQRLPHDVVMQSQAILPKAMFIETGTYRGDVALMMAKHFDHVVTIEVERGLWAVCKDRLPPNATAVLGDSAQMLSEILESHPRMACILWLDAHWSGKTTGAGDTECPLLAELKALSEHDAPWIAIIDDARYFRSPPPPPHNPCDWPSLNDIISAVPPLGAIGSRDDFFVVCSHLEYAKRLFHSTAIQSISESL